MSEPRNALARDAEDGDEAAREEESLDDSLAAELELMAQWQGLCPGAMPPPEPPARAGAAGASRQSALDAAELGDELGHCIAALAADGAAGQFSIQLGELGQVDGHVAIDGRRVRVALRPQRAATRELLVARRRHVERRASDAADIDISLFIADEA